MSEGGPSLVSAADLSGGAVIEKLDAELSKAWENIRDAMTDATKARTVTCKITIKPDENRDEASIGIVVSSSLAPHSATEGRVTIADIDGQACAVEHQDENRDWVREAYERDQAAKAERAGDVPQIGRRG